MTSAVTGQGSEGVGPETDLQGSPEGAMSEDEACVKDQAAVDGAWEAQAHDASLVMTEVALGGQKVGPES